MSIGGGGGGGGGVGFWLLRVCVFMRVFGVTMEINWPSGEKKQVRTQFQKKNNPSGEMGCFEKSAECSGINSIFSLPPAHRIPSISQCPLVPLCPHRRVHFRVHDMRCVCVCVCVCVERGNALLDSANLGQFGEQESYLLPQN